MDTYLKPSHSTANAKGSIEKATEPAFRAGWESLASLPIGIGNGACGVLDGCVTVAGGITWRDNTKIWLDKIWRFEPKKNTWSEAGLLPHSLAYPACGQTDRGLFLAAGGIGGGSSDSLKASFLLNDELQIRKLGDFPEALFLSGAAVAGEKLYIVGGLGDLAEMGTATDRFYAVDSKTGRVENLAAYPGGKVVVPAVTAVGGRIYAFAGAIPDSTAKLAVNLADAFVYSIAEARWSRIPAVPFTVRGLASCALDDRYILLAGGYGEDFRDDAVVYDTMQACYFKTMPLPYRTMPNLVKMGGSVYCFGGEDKMRHRSALCYRMRWAELVGGSRNP